MHLTNAQQKYEATIQNKLSATPITGSTALLPYRIHIVKEKPFNATGGSFTRNPERLVEEVVAEPVKRSSKKTEEAAAGKPDLSKILADWDD